MSKPYVQIGDERRQMTNDEYEQYQRDCVEAEIRTAALNKMAATKISAYEKLKTLGLTDDEIQAFFS